MGIHHIVVNDWSRGVDADQNVVLISIPSVLGKGLAPPGKHVLHAYTPGTESFDLWEGLDRKSMVYRKLKEERSEVHTMPALLALLFYYFVVDSAMLIAEFQCIMNMSALSDSLSSLS